MKLSTWLVFTSNGCREWEAEDAAHAIEQHADAFTFEGKIMTGETVMGVMLKSARGWARMSDGMLDLHNWCIARLKDAREEGAIDEDTSDAVIEREAEKLELSLQQYASSFIDNEFDESKGSL